jgi:hypothetical protein
MNFGAVSCFGFLEYLFRSFCSWLCFGTIEAAVMRMGRGRKNVPSTAITHWSAVKGTLTRT